MPIRFKAPPKHAGVDKLSAAVGCCTVTIVVFVEQVIPQLSVTVTS